jgi:hypothetical protein
MDWEQRPGEPPRWYARFEQYRLLGTTRTLERAFRRCAEIEGLKATRPGAGWYDAARAWEWSARAAAWDAVERDRLRSLEEDRRFDAREARLSMIHQMLLMVFGVLEIARLPDLSLEEARSMLPMLRALFKDLLIAERVELGSPAVDVAQGVGTDSVAFTADNLLAAQRELERWQSGAVAIASPDAGPAPPSLLVAVGPDPVLRLDIAMLRAVEAETGLQIKVLADCTKLEFEHHLQRVRAVDRPVRWLQMSFHMRPEAVHFADGDADGDWLSSRLLGVEVLVLAGCAASDVGDWLGVVPYVISFGEAVENRAAAWFVRAFWSSLAAGATVDAALHQALERSPPVMREFVEWHW